MTALLTKIKPKLRPWLAAVSLSLFSMAPVFAAFEDISVGGRPTALSGAYTAVEGDAYSLYYNPAALAGLSRAEFGAQYSKLHIGLTDDSDLSNSFAGIAQPLKFGGADYGTIGAGWMRFALAGLYQENTIIISWSRDIIPNRFSFGANAKILSITYGDDDYTKNSLDNEGKTTGRADPLFEGGYVKSAFDADIGLRYPFARNYAVAFAAQNVAGANISLANDPSVTLPRRYRLGIAHSGKSYTLAADVAATSDSNAVRGMFGAEKTFAFGGAFRAGVGMGSDGWANLAGGIGFRADALSFDYGLAWPLSGIKNTAGSHRVSINLKFGPILR
ncbi:MAG: type IX secretion system membrane protein PorP/SprF, partial [Endomicrobiia bacterium]|nr:type IX secretion system membrane protein PorP/SprF [Endomicrobiia bacterium]